MKLVLDVDTGTDDAVAIMMAALHPSLELVACTVVNGNAPVEYCTDNTLRVLDHIHATEIPVYQGAYRPLSRNNFPIPRQPGAEKALHGMTLELAPTNRAAEKQHAVNFLIEHFNDPDCETTLVAVGPLTNLALACALDPSFAKNVKKLIIMGGGHAVANYSCTSEFNFWADPEAASIVLSAGFDDITLVTLDATHQALVTYDDCDTLEGVNTPASNAAAGFIRKRIDVHEATEKMEIPGSAPVHDALCVGALINPDLITTHRLYATAETVSPVAIGQSIIDRHRRSDFPPNCDVALSSDRKGFIGLMIETLSRSL